MRQRWKRGLSIVPGAPSRPPHSAAGSFCAFQVSASGLWCRRPARRAEPKRVPGLDPLGIGIRVCGQRAEGAQPAAWRRVPTRSPGVPRRARALLPPSPGPPENHPCPVCRAQLRDRSGKVRRLCPPNPRPGPGKPRTAGQNRNFPARRARSAVAWSRLPALSPCARRQIGSGPAAGRAGGEDGRLPGDGGPGSAASCRGGGRAGAERPRADRPPPWLGGRCGGRLPQRGRAGPVVRFRSGRGVNHEDPSSPAPRLGLGPALSASGDPWPSPPSRPAPASPVLLRHRHGNRIFGAHKIPTGVNGNPLLGLFRGGDTPGLAAGKSTSCSALPWADCIRQGRDLFWPAGF